MKHKFILGITLSLVCLTFASCKKSETKWEYKTINVKDKVNYAVRRSADLPVIKTYDDELNSLGADGWELVGVYDVIGTDFPNFGDEKYHTGIKENVKTVSVHLIFKREKRERANNN